MKGGQFAKNDAPLLLFCQLSKEDKLMPLERSPPERRGRVKILNLNLFVCTYIIGFFKVPK